MTPRSVTLVFFTAVNFFLSASSTAFAKADKKAASEPVRLAWEAEPRTIDPRYASDANGQYLSDLVHCSLINFDKDGKTIGSLAKEWQWVNPTTLEIALKEKVKFSDGSIVTAKDVKATYDFFKKENLTTPSPLAGAFKLVTEVKVINPNKVQFILSEADSSFITNLMIGILPAAFGDKEMIADAKQMIGCGPFQLEKADPNIIILVRNPQYALGAPAKSARLEILVVKDEMTRFAKLQKGEVDLVQNTISRDKVEQISKQFPGLKVAERNGLNVTYLGFNFKDPALSQLKVRQAIGMAINRQIIIDYILKKMATVAKGMLTPNDIYASKEIAALKYDPEKAKKLLDEAGLKEKNGKPRLHLTYKTTTDITRINIAKAIASQLKQIGIKVDVESLEWGKFKADIEKGQVQLWSLSWMGFKDPDIYRFAFSTENAPPNGGNRGWYSNKKLDELLAKARVTTDLKARQGLYNEVQKVVAEELPYIFLWHEQSFAILNKSLNGFELFADGRLSSLVNATK